VVTICNELLSALDEDTLEYVSSSLSDEDAAEGVLASSEDLCEFVGPLLEDGAEMEEEDALALAERLWTALQGEGGGVATEKLLKQPVLLAMVAREQEQAVAASSASLFAAGSGVVNYNEQAEAYILAGTDGSEDSAEFMARLRMAKRSEKHLKKDSRREKVRLVLVLLEGVLLLKGLLLKRVLLVLFLLLGEASRGGLCAVPSCR